MRAAARLSAAPATDSNSALPLLGNGNEEQFYSSLTRVNDKNVKTLGLAWYADLPTKDGLVGNPLVAHGIV
jgi:glucose dehydrogenase